MDCGISWGDWATWATAAVTLGALVAAIVAVRKSGELLKVEQGRDIKRDQRDEELRKAAARAEQADLVAAWSVFDGGWGARLVNSSPLPVYGVTVDFHGPNGDHRASSQLSLVTPGESFVKWPRGLLLPGEKAEAAREFQVALRFRDTAGRTWRRDITGQLNQTGVVVFGGQATEADTALPGTVEGGEGDAPSEQG